MQNKCFSKKHIPPYGALLTPKIRPSLGLSTPKIGDLSEIRLNRHAEFHTDRESPMWLSYVPDLNPVDDNVFSVSSIR